MMHETSPSRRDIQLGNLVTYTSSRLLTMYVLIEKLIFHSMLKEVCCQLHNHHIKMIQQLFEHILFLLEKFIETCQDQVHIV